MSLVIRVVPLTSAVTRFRVDIEVALITAVLLTAVNTPHRLTFIVAGMLFCLSSLCSAVRRSGLSSWTQSYLSSIVLLGILAFSWVLFVSHGSNMARILVVTFTTLALGIVLVALGRSGSSQSAETESQSNPRFEELLVPAVAALLLSFRGFFPLLATASAILVSAVIARQRVSFRTTVPTIAVCVGAAQFSRSWFDREPYWFFISYDQQFRASLATGLTRWGYTDLNSATGTRISYHWLAEAISGVLSRIGSVDEFIVVTQVFPVLGFLAAVASMWRLTKSIGLNAGAALVGVMIPSLVLLEMDPYSIGTLLGVALTCYCIELSIRHPLRLIDIVAVATVATLLLMAQTPFGLTTSLALFVYAIFSRWRTRKSAATDIAVALLVLVPLVGLRLTVLAPGKSQVSSGSLGFENILQFGGLNVDVGIDLDSPAWLTALNSTGYLVEILVIALPVLICIHYQRRLLRPTSSFGARFSIALLAVSVVVINVLNLSFAQGKLMSAVLVAFMPVSISLAWTSTRSVSGVSLGVLGIVSGLGLARLYFLARNVEPDYLAAALAMTTLGLAVIAIVLASRIVAVAPGRDSQTKKVRIAALAALALVVGVSVGRPERIPVSLSRQPIEQAAIVGSPELRACLEWLRRNTPTASVVATDFFDPVGLSGEGKSHLVSLVAKRRLLLDGLYTKFAEQELVDQRTLRADAITETPLQVDFFVISSKLAETSATSDLDVMLRNSTCVVLRRQLE